MLGTHGTFTVSLIVSQILIRYESSPGPLLGNSETCLCVSRWCVAAGRSRGAGQSTEAPPVAVLGGAEPLVLSWNGS